MAATAAASPPAPLKAGPCSPRDHLPRPSVAISWDSQDAALHNHAERCKMESKSFVIDPALLPTLEGLLQEMYASLLPEPVDYEHRHAMINVFNKIAAQISRSGTIGSFLKINRGVVLSHRPSFFLNFCFLAGIRFLLLGGLQKFYILIRMKFWAKAHDVNSPKDRTMSSMAIISLVAFHSQTRCPPILPAFSAILKDGSDSASIERNVSLFEGFGSRNKETIAELFVSLMNKLVSVERGAFMGARALCQQF